MTERAQIAGRTFLESMLAFHTFDTSVQGKGPATMQLLPDTTLGNFFNRQDRSTTSFQWVETASGSRKGPLGVHALKAGIDLLHTGYEGNERQPAGSREALGRHTGEAAGVRQPDDGAIRSRHGLRGICAGPHPAPPALVGRARRAPRSRRDHQAHRRHAARGSGRSAGRDRQHRAPRRHRRVLRENAARRGCVRRVREHARHAVRHRRCHAARPGRALHARHRAEPPGRPQHRLGPLLRQASEPDVRRAPERPRPARQSRAGCRSCPDGHRRRAALEQHRRLQLPAAGSEPPRHARNAPRHHARRTSIRPRIRI